MKISVIIPAHNETAVIEKTIRSFQKQTLKPLEIIVVCDSCTDRTAQLARKLGARVLEKEYRNTAKTRNAGIRISRGEILIMQDADTLAAPNYLEKVAEAVESGFVYGAGKSVSDVNFFITKIRLYFYNIASVLLGGFYGSSLFVTRTALFETPLYDTQTPWAEDWHICMQLKKIGPWTVLFDTYVVYCDRSMQNNGYMKEYAQRLVKFGQYLLYSLKYWALQTVRNLLDTT